ncbi:MAG: shikimate dehydrogenase, partial [Lachnospiraceae bacterium]|nr:shikimate dehydrogenase [Lachnospiraceae bacterium]
MIPESSMVSDGSGGGQMFTGKTRNLGIMGWPVEHSLSPAMQNAAIRAAGLDYAYVALPVKPENIDTAVEGLRSLGFVGWNVTIPHKSAILSSLDEVHEDARMIGAVNTVVQREGKLIGYNTDVTGFLAGLSQMEFSVAGKRVAVLGAGGAARAILWGLCREKAGHVTFGVRNPEKAEKMVGDFSAWGDISVVHWEDAAFAEYLTEADL